MKKKTLKILVFVCTLATTACSQSQNTTETTETASAEKVLTTVKQEPHRYGGWYCPDNLNGFPPVDIANWKNVPVVNGRMATKEETQNGTSLIFVDQAKYPDAKPLDMTMPQLAKFYSPYSKRDELVIIIQAIKINNDSIVGFRYLNGGNGSAHLNEINILHDNEITLIPENKFISHEITIGATQNEVWQILRKSEYLESLQPIFDKKNTLKADWIATSNVNYNYHNAGMQTAGYGDKLFGNFYIQNDYANYNEKFLLLEDQKSHQTTLKIVSGPHDDDYETQEAIIKAWAKQVKVLSEKH